LTEHFLEPTDATGNNQHFLFNDPNPALSAVLVSPTMQGIVAEYTSKVATVYLNRIEGRSRSHELQESVKAHTFIGGFKDDRHVGEVVVSAPYAAADEFGRHEYNPYAGSHDLRDSLYSVLPQEI
jgi:hypothetical protein